MYIKKACFSDCVMLQAVMYVLSFRMRTLLDDAHEREALRRMHVKGFVKHPLNPLKVSSKLMLKFNFS